ncbi:MAG: ATP-binding protein [Anaerolineae bacterium]|jgi:PAS domain S-box-containing protein
MQPATILVVCSTPSSRHELTALLAGEDYHLLHADDPAGAMILAAENPPDLIFLDATLSPACHLFRDDPALAQIPILASVPQDDLAAREKVLEQGADDFINHPFDPFELLARLRTFARLSGLRRQLYDALGRHAAKVTILNKIGQVITSSLDLGETLAIIAEHAHWLLDVEATSVILPDPESGHLWFGAAHGAAAAFVQDRRLDPGKGIAHWVIEHDELLLVEDVTQDPRFFAGWDEASGFVTRSILCVPLRVKGETIGAIEAINKVQGSFDQEDLTVMTSLAAYAAIAIENARLYKALQNHAANLEKEVDRRTQQLQAERDRTQAILEAVGEAVIVTDLEGRIQYLNPAGVELTGYTLDEARGRMPRLWQQQEEPLSRPPGTEETSSAVETQRTEIVSRRRDGSLYDAATTVAPLFDSQDAGRLIGHVCVQRDITPIKDAERLKDQFVSNVSHELRTPLSIIALISGNLDRLYDRLDDDKRHKLIRDIREQAQLLTDLIGDVLEISRIESGRISMERQEIDLMALVQEETRKQLPLAQKKDQTLRLDGTGPLPIWGNADQLRQIVSNLLNNAIKYTLPQGQVTCECAALATPLAGDPAWPGARDLPRGRWAALRIVDSGMGIGPEDLPRIFERFYRTKTEGNIPGTGLGLSIVKELTEAHGGHVVATSTPGQGSTFAIYFPRLED